MGAGHSPKIAAQHYLMSREHHFDDVVAGGGAVEPSVAGAGQAVPESCSADCSALATQNATQQASALASTESHKTTEPAATIQVAAGSSMFAPVTKTGQVAGTGTEQTRFCSGKPGVTIPCDAKCDAISTDRLEVLARAVVLVAGMKMPEAAREAVLARVVAGLTQGAAQSEHPPGTRRQGPRGHAGRHPSVRSASR